METQVGEETILEPWTTTITQQPPTLIPVLHKQSKTQTGYKVR